MNKILKYFGGIKVIIFFLIVGSICMILPNDTNDAIHLRVSKIYTVGGTVKCYELVPEGKYQDLNHVTIQGDSGIPLQIDQKLDLIIIKNK